MSKSKYQTYPKEDGIRSGCKVSWLYYRERADAEAAATAARHNARIDAAAGYDFGYCSPGSIAPAHANSQYAGMWEVCIS